jgi:hypothetical protein
MALRFGPALRLADLDEVEQAIHVVGTRYGGSLIGTAIDEVDYTKAWTWLTLNDVPHQSLNSPSRLEFQVAVAGQMFDVLLQRAPNGNDCLFRVMVSEPWLDELFGWMRSIGLNYGVAKVDLPSAHAVHIGAAHAPECRYETPNHVPASIYRLKNLKSLKLVYRNIVSLPKTVGRMSQLEELKLGGNELTELPEEVCALEGLKLLTLWSNELKRLPQGIGNLRRLEGLDICSNDLRALPESIVEIHSLRRFYLNGNEKLILSDIQERWLAGLIEGGAEVCVDESLRDRLIELRPHFSSKLSHTAWFNSTDLEAEVKAGNGSRDRTESH